MENLGQTKKLAGKIVHASTMEDGPHRNSSEQVRLKLRATLNATLDGQGPEDLKRSLALGTVLPRRYRTSAQEIYKYPGTSNQDASSIRVWMVSHPATCPKGSSRKFKCPSRLWLTDGQETHNAQDRWPGNSRWHRRAPAGWCGQGIQCVHSRGHPQLTKWHLQLTEGHLQYNAIQEFWI